MAIPPPLCLQIYLTHTCTSCQATLDSLPDLQRQFPALQIELIFLDQPGAYRPPHIFAVPTYCLNERVISLGNPSFEELQQHVKAELARLKLR